jgi:uncharacterized protein (UPF0335 family)
MSDAVAPDLLKAFVERIERLEEEKASIAGDVKEVYAEAKAQGFDAKILRKVVALRKRDVAERREEEEILDLYLQALGNDGVLTPELRLGWNHEFLDASQKITASLVGVTGSGFSATGVVFGRDAALLGAGFSMELSPDAKVFVDYDDRLGSRLQEHSISGGLKVRF